MPLPRRFVDTHVLEAAVKAPPILMAEPIKYNLRGAELPSGAIDFYVLLGQIPTAQADALGARIQELYVESQANRDHRNLNKRREYQALIELLPAARAVLLDAPKRALYDEYLQAAQNGTADPDFEIFMNELMGLSEQPKSKTAIMGRKNERALPEKTVEAASQAQSSAPNPVEDQVISPRQSENTDVSVSGLPVQQKAFGGAALGLVLGAVGGYFLAGALLAICLGLLGAVLGFALFNKSGATKISH